MSHFKQFSYPDITRRWMILFALFLSLFSLTLMLTDTIVIFKQYVPYYPIIKIILFMTLMSFLSIATSPITGYNGNLSEV